MNHLIHLNHQNNTALAVFYSFFLFLYRTCCLHYPQCSSNADSLAEDLIFSVQLRHLSDFTHLCTAFTAALPNTFDVSNQRRNCKLSFKPRKDLMFFILKKKQDIGRKTVDAPWPLYCICGSSQTNLQLIKMIWLIGELGSPQKPTSLVIQPF